MAEDFVSGPVAVVACTAMAIFYVAVLYSPTLILRLPPATSLSNFMIRRFVCAAVSSVVSVSACYLLLPIRGLQTWSSIFGTFGVRLDHLWQVTVFPIILTSLLYSGSFASKSLCLVSAWREDGCHFPNLQGLTDMFHAMATNVMAWRNYIVAPLTEELVFRACMISLLLCGGFKIYNIIFVSPIFFSLAHLNHFLELYCLKKYSFLKSALVVGVQLGYTVIFGWYASFLFVRTGHLLAPIVVHMFCNCMGLPVLSSSRGRGLTIMASLAGIMAFLWLLFPFTNPTLYNYKTDNCRCWHGYCSWKSK